MAVKNRLPKRSKNVDSLELYQLVLQATGSTNVEYRNAADSIRSILVHQMKSKKVLLPPEMIQYYKKLLKLDKELWD